MSKKTNKNSNQGDLSNDHQRMIEEAMRSVAAAMREPDDKATAFTDDDMNDPDLLAELAKLQGQSSRTQDSKPEKSMEIDDTSAQEKLDNLANHMDAYEAQSVKFQFQSEKNEDANETSQAIPSTVSMEINDSLSSTERIKKLLIERHQQYYNMAGEARKTKHPRQKELIEGLYAVKNLVQKFKDGEVVDEAAIPSPPAPLQAAAKVKQNPPYASSLAASAVSSPSSSSLLSQSYAAPSSSTPTKSPPASSLSQSYAHPSPSPPATPEPSAAEIRERRFVALESLLQKQIAEAANKALAANDAGKKLESSQLMKKRKEWLNDLELVKLAHAIPTTPPPAFHIQEVVHQEEVINSGISAHEMEVTIVKLQDVRPPSLSDSVLDTFVKVEMQYPENHPNSWKTDVVKGTLSPVFNHVHKIRIERNKAFERALKKKVVLQVWMVKGGLLGLFSSGKLLGRSELALTELANTSEVNLTLDILEETGKKSTGGKMHVIFRLQTPLLKKQIKVMKEKILAIDKHYVDGSGEPIPVPATTSATEIPIKSVDSVIHATPTENLKCHPNEQTSSLAESESASILPKNETSSSAPTSSNVSNSAETIPNTSPTRSSEITSSEMLPHDQLKAAAEIQTDDPILTHDFNALDNILSYAVMEWRKTVITAEIQKLKSKGKLTDEDQEEMTEKEAQLASFEGRVHLIIAQVQSGVLSQDKYVELVQTKIKQEESMLPLLEAAKRMDQVAFCKQRIQIMKSELVGET